jgi:hypothetical protein
MIKGFFLLQNVQYFKEDNPVQAMILLIIIGAVIVISLVVGFIRNGIHTGGGPGRGRTTVTPRKFNAFTLHRIANTYGLDKDQSKLLEFVFRNDGVSDPERVMGNAVLLDKHFKRAYRTIEQNAETEDEAQDRLVRLFSLRNTIESASGNSGSASTNQIAENTAAVLSTGKESYSVRVISSKGAFVVVESP